MRHLLMTGLLPFVRDLVVRSNRMRQRPRLSLRRSAGYRQLSSKLAPLTQIEFDLRI